MGDDTPRHKTWDQKKEAEKKLPGTVSDTEAKKLHANRTTDVRSRSLEGALGATAVDAARGPKDAAAGRHLLVAGALHHSRHVAAVKAFPTQLFANRCLLLTLLKASDFHLLCNGCARPDGPGMARRSAGRILPLLVLHYALLHHVPRPLESCLPVLTLLVLHVILLPPPQQPSALGATVDRHGGVLDEQVLQRAGLQLHLVPRACKTRRWGYNPALPQQAGQPWPAAAALIHHKVPQAVLLIPTV